MHLQLGTEGCSCTHDLLDAGRVVVVHHGMLGKHGGDGRYQRKVSYPVVLHCKLLGFSSIPLILLSYQIKVMTSEGQNDKVKFKNIFE